MEASLTVCSVTVFLQHLLLKTILFNTNPNNVSQDHLWLRLYEYFKETNRLNLKQFERIIKFQLIYSNTNSNIFINYMILEEKIEDGNLFLAKLQ